MQLAHLYQLYFKYPHITIDNRKVIKDSVFFAVGRKDERGVHRGCQFAEAALEAGAAVVVVNDPELFENYKTIFLGTDNNKFNKNIILLSIREMTNLSTKEIRTAMKRFKKLYYVVLNKIIE